MSNKNLKDNVYEKIQEAQNNLEDISDALENLEIDIGTSAENYLYKLIEDVKQSIDNIRDAFYDFQDEVDDIHHSISELLGKVGN